MCDQWIEAGVVPIKALVPILLDGCESLAMVGLIVGLLVRHLESADDLLDPYLTEPVIWVEEFRRVASEAGGLAASSEGLVAPERRDWSLREAAMFMGMKAHGERAAELRALGETLIVNARRLAEPAPDCEPMQSEPVTEINEQLVVQARAWASSLDRDRYQAQETEGGFYVKTTPPDDVAKALQGSHEDLERAREATGLIVRYLVEPRKGLSQARGHDELVADIATAWRLIEYPPSRCVLDPWDTAALVAAAALEAHLVESVRLPDDSLSFAVEILLRIGEGAAESRQYEFESTLYKEGADRSVARALPLLLLPIAAQFRAVVDGNDGSTIFGRTVGACVNLARAVVDEVRLYLACGLDHVWKTPCVEHGHCHHELGWRIATETLSRCVLGARNPETGRRSVLALKEPITVSLASTADDSIRVFST